MFCVIESYINTYIVRMRQDWIDNV